MGNLVTQFNRVASGSLGSTAGYALAVQIKTPPAKMLNTIFVSVTDGNSPVTNPSLIIRIGVFSQLGDFPELATILDYNPTNVSGTDVGLLNVGTVYFDHVITLPQNQIITFDSPLSFVEGEEIAVVCSAPYGVGDTILTVPNRFVRLSVNGYQVGSPKLQFNYR